MRGPAAARRLCHGEEGLTLIEVLVTALMFVLIVSAATVFFITGNDNSLASQRRSQLISIADQQIEMIREEVKTYGFDKLAMSAAPAAGSSSTFGYSSTTPVDPNYFASASTGCGASNEGYAIEADYDNTASGPASGVTPWSGCTNTSSAVAEPLEILTGGFVTPQQTNIAVGTDTATVDTYVTDTYLGCSSSALGGCPSTTGNVVGSCTWPATTSASTTCADARRVIVAVVLNNHGRYNIGPSAPVYVSTIFAAPTPSNAPNSTVGITLGVQVG